MQRNIQLNIIRYNKNTHIQIVNLERMKWNSKQPRHPKPTPKFCNQCTIAITMMNWFLWLANKTTYLSLEYSHTNWNSTPNQQHLESSNSLSNWPSSNLTPKSPWKIVRKPFSIPISLRRKILTILIKKNMSSQL